MNWGSVLTTGGGLVFNGGTNDRMFRAFDARTGEQLWQFKTNSGIMAPPSLLRGRRHPVHRGGSPAGASIRRSSRA